MITVHGMAIHVREWGCPDAPPLVLLHGGRDASATFQFLVDAFKRDWRVIAPDWRGHGNSGRAPEGYWFQDFLRDLDGLLDQMLPGQAVPIAGHSLGGNIACLYAGIRPERLTHLVSLDGFGLPDSDPARAPAHLKRWLEAWRSYQATGPRYETHHAMAERLIKANPRLSPAKAQFLAEHVSRALPGGGLTWSFDAMHRLPFATLHRSAETEACLRQVKAPALWIGSDKVFPPMLANEPGGFAARAAMIPGCRYIRIPGAGHNLHHDEPEIVADLIERHLTGAALPAEIAETAS